MALIRGPQYQWRECRWRKRKKCGGFIREDGTGPGMRRAATRWVQYGDKRGRVRAVSAMLVGVFKVTSIKSRPRYRGYLFLSTQYLQIFYFLLLVKSEKV